MDAEVNPAQAVFNYHAPQAICECATMMRTHRTIIILSVSVVLFGDKENVVCLARDFLAPAKAYPVYDLSVEPLYRKAAPCERRLLRMWHVLKGKQEMGG